MPSLRWLPFVLVALAAYWLRTHELTQRPMHADEANQAVKLGGLLEAGRYEFDPRDHHGPVLYYMAVPIALLRGERTTAQLTETTVRLVPAFFGTVSVLLVGWLALSLLRRDPSPAGPAAANEADAYWPAVAASALVAVSPPAVYYSRYYIQETLLGTFILAAVVCARLWWLRQSVGWAIATGICAGLAQATKASAPIFLAAALLAAWLCRSRSHERERVEAPAPPSSTRSRSPRPLAAAIGAAIATAALFYSSFFTHVAGLRDAVLVYAHAFTRFGTSSGPTGHEHEWWFYLRPLGWYRDGLVWQQLGLSVLAIAGLVVAYTRGERRLRAVAIYTVVIVGAYSIFSYKTPWHAVHFVPGMALLAGGALAALNRLRTGRFVAIAAGLLVVGSQYQQTARVAFQRPTDYRNPYAYVHSSADVLKARPLAEAARARAPEQPIWVISEEPWPLPWYLRGIPRVGYWYTPPEDCDGALVIVSSSQAEAVRAKLRHNYTESIFGLRPGFVCVVFTPVP